MYSSKHYINIISTLLIFFSGLLIISGSLARYSSSIFLITIIYAMLFAGIIVLFLKFNFNKLSLINQKIKIITSIFLFLLTTIYLIFVPNNLNSLVLFSIENWLASLFDGLPPYNLPSSSIEFPFFYVLVIPFYLIGITKLITSAGIAFFLFIFVKISKSNNEYFLRIILLVIFLLLGLIFNIGLEESLIVGILLFFIYFIENKELHDTSSKVILPLSICFGLLISTHLLTAVAIFIYFFFYLRNNFSTFLKVFVLSMLFFLLTIFPFFIWDYKAFINNNPFLWQSELLNISSWGFLLFLTGAMIGGYMISDIQEYFFTTGVIIFLIVTAGYTASIFEFGLWEAIKNGSLKLNYLTYSFPFLILSIKGYKVDRFLGKVLSEQLEI